MLMRPFDLSDATEERFRALADNQVSVWQKMLGSQAANADRLFDEIAESDELIAVAPLAVYLSSDPHYRELAKAAIRRIMAGRTPDELRKLDDRFRSVSIHAPITAGWDRITSGCVSRIIDKNDAAIVGMLSFHWDGQVRAEAIKHLNKMNTGDELVYLLIRANDWVPRVRNLARSAIENRLNSRNTDALADNLELISSLESKTRTDLSGLLKEIYGFLRMHPSGLRRAIGNPRFRVRRSAFRASYQLDEPQKISFIAQALRDSDSLIRLHAARQVSALEDPVQRREFLDIMRDDRWHAIRSLRLHIAVDDNGSDTEQILLGYILDRSPAIRFASRFFLSKRGIESFRTIYRDALDTNNVELALRGLGECGAADDIALIEPYMLTPNNKVLASAISAKGKLQTSQSDDWLVSFLTHEHKAPANAAFQCLRSHMSTAGQTAVVAVFEDRGALIHSRLLALKLLEKAGKWERLIFWLQGVSDDQPRVSTCCERSLSRWEHRFNQTFTQPTSAQIEQIRSLVNSRRLQHHPSRRFIDSVTR